MSNDWALTLGGLTLTLGTYIRGLVTHLCASSCVKNYKKYFRLWPIQSSRIVFSLIPIEFGETENSDIRSADPENAVLEQNME